MNDFQVKITFDIFEELPLEVWRWLVKYAAGFKCEVCGRTGKWRLHAHHINCNPEDNYLANGVYVCTECHAIWHQQLRERQISQLIEAALERAAEVGTARPAEAAQEPISDVAEPDTGRTPRRQDRPRTAQDSPVIVRP